MRRNGAPNLTAVSKRRVRVGSTRSRHPSFGGDCALTLKHIYGFGNMMDLSAPLASWTVAATGARIRRLC